MSRDETDWWFQAAEAAFRPLEAELGFAIVERHRHFQGQLHRLRKARRAFRRRGRLGLERTVGRSVGRIAGPSKTSAYREHVGRAGPRNRLAIFQYVGAGRSDRHGREDGALGSRHRPASGCASGECPGGRTAGPPRRGNIDRIPNLRRGRPGVLRPEGLLQRSEALHELPGQPPSCPGRRLRRPRHRRSAWLRARRRPPQPRVLRGGLLLLWQPGPGALQATDGPPRLLLRLLQDGAPGLRLHGGRPWAARAKTRSRPRQSIP